MPATFAQAMSSTKAAAPMRTRRRGLRIAGDGRRESAQRECRCRRTTCGISRLQRSHRSVHIRLGDVCRHAGLSGGRTEPPDSHVCAR